MYMRKDKVSMNVKVKTGGKGGGGQTRDRGKITCVKITCHVPDQTLFTLQNQIDCCISNNVHYEIKGGGKKKYNKSGSPSFQIHHCFVGPFEEKNIVFFK